MNFLRGTTRFDSFLNVDNTNETKRFSPYEWFNSTEKSSNKELPPYDSFLNNLRFINPPEKHHSDGGNLVQSGLCREQTSSKLRLDTVPRTGLKKNAYLQNIWDNEHMQSFADCLKWYDKKDVVSTLEAMQKKIEFFHIKGIGMLKLGCTLPNWANIS